MKLLLVLENCSTQASLSRLLSDTV